MNEDEAIILASMPKPEHALAYVEGLKTGRRSSVCAARAGLSVSEVNQWRRESSAFDDVCTDAEMIGVGRIDDIGMAHVEAGTPGWGAIWKTIMQQRDVSYSDKAQVQNDDTVKVIQLVPEAEPAPVTESVEVQP